MRACRSILAESSASFALSIHSSGFVIILNWVLFFFLCIAFCLLFFRIRARSTRWNIPTLIIGDTATASDILYAFNADPSTGFDVHTVFLRDKDHEKFMVADLPERYSNLHIEHDIQQYEEYITENPCNYYVIVLDSFRRIYWDSWYVRNWSFWGDIVIILKTIPAVIVRDDGH